LEYALAEQEHDVISILIPTRQRFPQLKRVIHSAKSTGVLSSSKVEFVCYVDDDDHSYDDFNEDVVWVRGPRIVLSNTWNKCAEVAKGDILMQGNDDISFITPGWDLRVESAFEKYPDHIVLVHGNDGSTPYNKSGRGEFGPHPFLHRRWIDTVGYMTPPYFSSDYGDTWLNDVANGIDRRHYINITVEHHHFLFGKTAEDQVTKERLIRHSCDSVEQLYNDLAPLRERDIEKLKAVISP
jgi:hypothetical protein